MEQKAADQLINKIFPEFRDAGAIYCDFLDAHIEEGDKILNAGCGEQAHAEPFFKRAGEVIGIDKIEPERVPSYLDQFLRADLIRLPLPDSFFDVIVAEWVFEHLQKPEAVLNEFKRILKPGGKIIFMTTNINSFLGTISLMTPTFFHKFTKKVFLGIKESDTFPTKYKINTPKKVEKIFKSAGYEKLELKTVAALGYWRFSQSFLTRAAKLARKKYQKNKTAHGFHIIGVYQLR